MRNPLYALSKAHPGHYWTWKSFRRNIRNNQKDLLARIDDYNDSIFIAGCQRSGTTALSRIITNSDGLTNFQFGHDDELDAALLLSGTVACTTSGRHCFQTTYLNEHVSNYFSHQGKYKLIWILRNPYSVIYSMLNNWADFALLELYETCGERLSEHKESRLGRLRVKHSKLKMACSAYNGKSLQIVDIAKQLTSEQLLVIDYDKLIANKELELEKIYDFIDVELRPEYPEALTAHSLNKSQSFSEHERKIISNHCGPIYNTLIEKFNI